MFIMLVFKTIVFVVCFFAHGSEAPLEIGFMPEASQIQTKKLTTKNEKSVIQISQSKPRTETSVPPSDNDEPQAQGIILAFKVWSLEKKNQTSLFEKLTQAGLKKNAEFKRFKIWIFEWPELHDAIKAEKLCDELSTLFFVDYCEPDYLLEPATEGLNQS